MPKKAKKGGKGGGKMEEERRLYLQQRAQAEEEMAKRREETLALFLKDKLQKNERNTVENLRKLREGWRSILRQTRSSELHEDIEELSQKFETDLEGVDSIIKSLGRDLQESERQSAQVRRVHLQHVERLWALQDKRLMFVQQQWENGLQHLSSRFISERKQNLAGSQQLQADLEGAAFTVEQNYKAVMDEIHRLYNEGIAAYRSTNNQEEQREQTPQRQEAEQPCSKATKTVDETPTKLPTHEHTREVERLQETITRLRDKLNYSETKSRSAEQDMTATCNQVKQKNQKFQQQLTQSQAALRKQLTDLTVQSDTAAKKLLDVIAKGQRVLHVADMCRRLENELKEVSLFPPEDHRAERTGPQTEEPAKEVQQLSRSISAALLQREALRKHRDDLSRESRQLKLRLRRHMDGMTVSGGLVGRTLDLDLDPPGPAGHQHAVIEALQAVRHSL